MPTACPDIIELERYALRDLDETTTTSVAEHLVGCAQCAQDLRDLTRNLELAVALKRAPGEPTPVFDDTPPESIGPYRILGKLGQGGMGAVYEAEQENPRRVVAVKVIRPGLVTPALEVRFRHEAQILGRLRHPGIAQIFEAGTHRSTPGNPPQPYLVMERVTGKTLLKYAESKKLYPAQRLTLMADICDAVHHAHQRGVIHRDLKPDNILIDETGGTKPQPKILDFGVARVIDPDGTTTTLHTNVGQIIGTIAYMSPEQANADPAEIDTRADVYALGVICFQLLADRLPYRLNNANLAESVRVIVQEEPTQLSSVDRRLRGDVSTIVGKALEKDKARRYQSAAEMAEDIRRYLRDEPIAAHRPSAMYQLRKFARRNKGLVGGVIAAILLLILGIIGTTIGMIRADRNAAIAKREADKQLAVTNFFKEMLASASPRNLTTTDRAKGRNVTVVEALNEAARKIDAGGFKDQPEVELAVRETLTTTLMELGEYDAASRSMEARIALARKLYGNEHESIASGLSGLAVMRHHQGRNAEAEPLARQALEMFTKLYGPDDIGVASALNNLASIVQSQGNLAEAESLLRRAREIDKRTKGPESRDGVPVINNLGTVLSDQGKYAEAEAQYREALKILRATRGEEHPDVALELHNIAAVLKEQDKNEEAETLYRQSIAMQRKLLGDDHPNLTYHLNNLARFLTEQKKYDEAEKLYKEAIEIHRKHFGDDTPAMATLINNMGTFYDGLDKLDEAEASFRKVLAMRRKLLGDDHPDTGAALHNLGYVLVEKKQFSEAETTYRQGLSIRIARLGEGHPDTASDHMQLGDCLTKLGRYDEAERELLTAHEYYRPFVAKRNHAALSNVKYLMTLYKAWGKPEKAAEIRATVPSTRAATRSAAATQST